MFDYNISLNNENFNIKIENNKLVTKSDISINDIVNILKKFEVLRENKLSIEDIILQNAKLTNVHEEKVVKKK